MRKDSQSLPGNRYSKNNLSRWSGMEARGNEQGHRSKKMLGRSGNTPNDPDATDLNTTLFAQPALFTVEYALARFWQWLGITPDAIVGHSMGEYVAACVAGVLSLEDALRLIATQLGWSTSLPQGAMLAVTLPRRTCFPYSTLICRLR